MRLCWRSEDIAIARAGSIPLILLVLHSILRPFRFFSDTLVFFPFVKIQDFILNAVGKLAAGFSKYQSNSSA